MRHNDNRNVLFNRLDYTIDDLRDDCLLYLGDTRQALKDHLYSNSPQTCLKLITPCGADEEINWYPCRKDIVEVAQIIDPEPSRHTHRNCLYYLANNHITNIVQLGLKGRYDKYQNIYTAYPESPEDEFIQGQVPDWSEIIA